MQASNEPFAKIIDGPKQFVIPVFQRDFCWTFEQCEQLWRDVKRAAERTIDSGHFMGSIVYIQGEGRASCPIYLLIDGQQRLTTLTVLMVALRDHIQATNWSGSDDGPTTEKLNTCYLKNTAESGQKRYKLVLRRRDKATLQALIDEKNPSELEAESSELLVEAYKFFRSALQASDSDPEKVYQGVARLNIVDVTLSRNVDNPQLVFESMNSTGIDLRQSDLVRNYLLMGLRESEQTRLYNEYWSKIESFFRASGSAFDGFLRDYMALEQGLKQQIRGDRTYDEFKSFWNSEAEKPLEDLLSDMVRVGRTYASFLGIATMQRPWLADAMSHMRSLNTTQALLVMRLYDSHEKDRLSREEFIRAVTLIESYLLRRAVLGLQTRGYWSVFARIAHDLNPDSVFESLKAAFARLGDNYRFPSDQEFSRELQERDLYDLRVCKHALDRLENFEHSEPSPVANYSIEHVMPQEITPEWEKMIGENAAEQHAAWVHRLGNLTLTAYNSKYSNRPFGEKKDIKGGFQDSAVRLNRDIKDAERWTPKEIDARGKRLAAQALQIWPHHKADATSIQEAERRDLIKRASKHNPSELKMDKAARQVLDRILASVRRLGDVIEVIEQRSVCCYYGTSFFAEILPMSGYVRVMLPLDFNEVAKPEGLNVSDSSSWKFVPNRVHTDSNLIVDVRDEAKVAALIPMIRQALDQSR
ncbi:MAG: DUF262 domain-containing protein [Gammaproteobacteria bacterium]|nr:DUF262 domain-containing protein [Gammaproteobacteria bacterium]